MRILSPAVALSLACLPLRGVPAAEIIRRPTLTSRELTTAILAGYRKDSDNPPPKPPEAPAAEEAEKITLPTMRVNTRRWYDESKFVVEVPPKPVLGTGVSVYRGGTIKVRRIFFIPVCVSIDW